MNVDRFDTWQWRKDANCWDFVVAWILEKQGVELPRFGIVPSDKQAMTRAAKRVIQYYCSEVDGPIDGAIAAHYFGKTNWHVGIVDGNQIRHSGEICGTRKDSIKKFESMAPLTRYFIVNGNIKNLR